ncbi:hypothetical protein C2W62_28810 [Candidatus Entotheonella serta]|nr:hypothetical protein C2W62_28810 [Candidatus Entotheonella serta]
MVAPGITVLSTPGHTNEDASLIVETYQGTVVFTHIWWFLSDGARVPKGLFPRVDPLAENPDQLEMSRVRVRDLADCIIPGHDPPFPNPFKEEARCHRDIGR